MQFDADTVGTDNIAADAEICMLAADTMEELGIPRGQYVVKVNSRKVLDGILEAAGLAGDQNAGKRLIVLRAIDKFDRLGVEGVRQLLGPGRKDESGDFTKGAGLSNEQIARILSLGELQEPRSSDGDPKRYVTIGGSGSLGVARAEDAGASQDMETVGPFEYVCNQATLSLWEDVTEGSEVGAQGIRELRELAAICQTVGYGTKRIRVDSSVVRGLEYYTGPVFETELTFESYYSDGKPVRFGSVGGGGRYDGLVERFLGTKVPATGFSIGVSRLQAALAAINKDKPAASEGPVVVLVMEKDRLADYQRMTQTLRGAGIRAEMYLGTAGMKAQMKYADRRGAPCVVIQGGDERAKGEVQIKDLIEGAKAAATIKDSKEWREGRPAQVSVAEADLVTAVREVLARHRG
jgi:histidyl-tRNA synthetase